jgi:hypothetical protein
MSFFHSLLSIPSAPTPSNALTFEGTSTVLSKSTYLIGDRAPGSVQESNYLIWRDGVSVLSYPYLWNGTYGGYGLMLKYDEKNGFHTAPIGITQKGGGADRHLQPSIGMHDDGTILVLHENDHIEDINVYHGSADLSAFTKRPQIEANSSRYQIYKISSGYAVIYQDNENDAVVQTCDVDGTNWSEKKFITTGGGASTRMYLHKPYGQDADENGWYYIDLRPVYSSAPNNRMKCLLKTQDFETFYNMAETATIVAGSTARTATELHVDGFAYIGIYNGTAEVGFTCSGISSEGDYFSFSIDTSNPGTPGTIITTRWNGSAFVSNTCNTGFDIQPPLPSVTAANPTWCFIRSMNEIYLIVGIDGKPHMLKSTNQGTTWSDLGDMLSDRSGYYTLMGPANANEIPDNRNFVFYFSEPVFDAVTPVAADLYAVRAAFGTIQPETPTAYTTSLTNISDISGARFIYEADDFDNTVTGFFDKSGNGRTGGKVGTPTLSSGAVTFNGTNQAIEISSPTDFNADTKFTFTTVAKLNSGSAGYLISFAVTSSNSAFCWIQLTDVGATLFFRSAGASETITVPVATFDSSVYTIFTVQGDGAHYRFYVNGVEKPYSFTVGSGVGDMINNGKWASLISGMNRVRLAGLGRQSPVYSPVSIKMAAYWPSVISRENRKKLENFLSTKYSISITNNVE